MSTTELSLPSGHTALIDSDSWPLVKGYAWHVSVDTHTNYAIADATTKDGKLTAVGMHRLIVSALPEQFVDHRNRNGLDNRRENLRTCTRSQNGGNRRINANNTSGYKGVWWNARRNKWQVALGLDGARMHLVYFTDPWDAAQAYNTAALIHFGEFALLNERWCCDDT